jgi:hypothetical protein
MRKLPLSLSLSKPRETPAARTETAPRGLRQAQAERMWGGSDKIVFQESETARFNIEL